MSEQYNYATEREKLWTEAGSVLFIAVRDRVKKLLFHSGAFTLGCAIQGVSGDTWVMIAAVDRLAELGEIRELTQSNRVRTQDRVFVMGGARCEFAGLEVRS